ncbi:hypothetical protein B0H12DRAFT_685622 [Mycena haematopus]|nr:hypothetical protein B0H12DRAFT_685622 [Mycena haematopus]
MAPEARQTPEAGREARTAPVIRIPPFVLGQAVRYLIYSESSSRFEDKHIHHFNPPFARIPTIHPFPTSTSTPLAINIKFDPQPRTGNGIIKSEPRKALLVLARDAEASYVLVRDPSSRSFFTARTRSFSRARTPHQPKSIRTLFSSQCQQTRPSKLSRNQFLDPKLGSARLSFCVPDHLPREGCIR